MTLRSINVNKTIIKIIIYFHLTTIVLANTMRLLQASTAMRSKYEEMQKKENKIAFAL
jgi:hypothetical protein